VHILAVADLHYALRQLDWIDSVAGDFDLLILGGDELDVASSVPVDAQIKVIGRYLEAYAEKTTVIVNSGNHDLDARAPDGEKVASWLPRIEHRRIHADGASIELEGIRFSVCPWWDGPFARARVEAMLEIDEARRGPMWAWVYHSPPAGPLSWSGQRHFGDDVVEAWIERFRPDFVFAGHVHQSPFTTEGSWVQRLGETWVFNAGRDASQIPTHVIVNTAEQLATWWSPYGAETMRLDEPDVLPLPA